MNTLVIITAYGLYKAVKFVAAAVKAAPKRISVENPSPAVPPLLLEEYSHSTVDEVRHLRRKWTIWKDELHRVHEAFSRHDAVEVTGDGLVIETIVDTKGYGRKRVKQVRYRSCGKLWSEGARRLFERGYEAATPMHIEDLLQEGRLKMRPSYVSDYKPSARRIADGIGEVISRCPSASWKIGKGAK